ncbi:5'-3' exoribonuclease 2 [Smittium culicis]|uniref:5'-3' exoribonuclease 2 n=1 Tax=Smittium culicis TaxID=133412 RepID=A0A1R1XFH9_9FUNG|nr:5'-3' exoribonuclease 2 [Smittium culicis]
MGVPAFYRWLIRKYPKAQSQVIEEKPTIIDGIEIPVDPSKPNPNGYEFDNLYLDMNGIVHPCCHPEGREAPKNEEEMMMEIFKCLDRVFNVIRPRKVVYMALDGVAPRAKMNQQRSRRFRAAFDAKIEAEKKARIISENSDIYGETVSASSKPWDSNCITPGTPFMEFLAISLRYYVAEKLNTDPAWKNIKVIVSDSNVPGEGEHKLMDFIRYQRQSPNYNPNTTHVIYGLDADLIMLALATHEPHFKILRDDVFKDLGSGNSCFKCGQTDHFSRECKLTNEQVQILKNTKKSMEQTFVFCHIDILREYLEIQLLPQNYKNGFWDSEKGPPYDLERAIDDWIFMCFFVGNDFLPHLPSLEIREGAIDKLLAIWKRSMYHMGGYLTDNGIVNLSRVQVIMDELSILEADTFVKRKSREDSYESRNNSSNALPVSTTSEETVSSEISSINSANKEIAHKLRLELFKSQPTSAGHNLSDGMQDLNSSIVAPLSDKEPSPLIPKIPKNINEHLFNSSEAPEIIESNISINQNVVEKPISTDRNTSGIESTIQDFESDELKSSSLKRKNISTDPIANDINEVSITNLQGCSVADDDSEEILLLKGNSKRSSQRASSIPPKKILKTDSTLATNPIDVDSNLESPLSVEDIESEVEIVEDIKEEAEDLKEDDEDDVLINKKDNVR